MANRSEFSNGETSRPGHQILVKALDGSLASQPALFHAAEGGRGRGRIDVFAAEMQSLEYDKSCFQIEPGIWERDVMLIYEPTLPEIRLEPVDQYVAVAMRMRPILNQTRLEIERGDLELVKTRNGLLPRLDLFVTLGKSGYANAFGDAFDRLDGDSYDAQAGLTFQLPLFNRQSEALHRRAQLTREQTQKAMNNLAQLVEVDVRTAHIEVDRTQQQIGASSATRRFDEEKLRTETEKLRVGRSTSYLVAQAQRDLLASRLAEVRALVNYIKALINLYRLDGSLLERRGIAAPGREPVQLQNMK